MEVLLEISKEEAEKLHISSSKITLNELKRKMAMLQMRNALEESHKIAKEYGLDKLTMDDVNNIVKEAKEAYNKAHEENRD